jgi:hypothetical protein
MQFQGHRRPCLHSRAARSSPRVSTASVQRGSSRRARSHLHVSSSSELVVGYTTPEQYYPAAGMYAAYLGCTHVRGGGYLTPESAANVGHDTNFKIEIHLT